MVSSILAVCSTLADRSIPAARSIRGRGTGEAGRTVSGWYGYTGEPVPYEYGETYYYEDGNVCQDGQVVATAEQYYDQAEQIADAGQTPQNEEWLPLGVFSVVAQKGQSSDKLVQLALNKEGVIQGSLYDKLTGQSTAIVGAVDKQTQRVAMKLEGNDSVVIETGLSSLTDEEVPVLVHFAPDRREPRTLVRLKEAAEPRSSNSQPPAGAVTTWLGLIQDVAATCCQALNWRISPADGSTGPPNVEYTDGAFPRGAVPRQ